MKEIIKLRRPVCIILCFVLALGVMPVTAFAETGISNVTLTGVTEPVVGQVPTVDGISLGENVEITSDTLWLIYDEELGYYSAVFDDTAPFEEGEKYSLQITAKPKDGYEFADDIKVLFNGSELSDFESVGNNFFAIVSEDSEINAGYMMIGLYFEVDAHTHSYGDWKFNETEHWKECECSDKSGQAEHTFNWVTDKEATATEKGSKHEECTVCGYKKAAVEIPATGSPANPPQTTDSTKINPNTGAVADNNSNIFLWALLLAVCGCAVFAVIKLRKKEKAK